MKAICMRKPGGPEVLELQEVDSPAAQKGEALVQLQASAINHLDIWIRMGLVPVTLPRILGLEGAGVVLDAQDSTRFKNGDQVVVTPWLYPDPPYDRPFNLSVRLLGVAQDGCYAEKIAVPETALLPLPQGFSCEEGAALPLAYVTAYHMIVTRAKVEPGETVLVTGASGGVGVAAIQILRHLGVRILALTRQEAKVPKLQAQGAEVVLIQNNHFSDAVHRLTRGQGVDCVIEQVGAAIWDEVFATVRAGGRIITCGTTSGAVHPVNLQALYRREIALLGAYAGTPDEMKKVFVMAGMNLLRPPIAAIFPLAEAAKAHQMMEEARHFGKIILKIGE
jgi:NADPH:quinone reductase-like Zn-dependent oxidoreductase